MKIKDLDIACLNTRCGTPTDGYDYDCDYEQSGEISCDDCICNYGQYSPKTGKRIPWLLRIIQNHRAVNHYKALNRHDKQNSLDFEIKGVNQMSIMTDAAYRYLR